MIDIHCHILPGIDDGSSSLKSSVTMVKKAAEAGITDIILTPHYIKGSKYDCKNGDKRKLVTKLRNAVKKEGIKVKFHLGNEIFLDENIAKLIKDRKVAPLGRSKYILIELPVREEDRSGKDILFELISAGYRVIIAHPERYFYFQENPHKIHEYIDLGCFMQGDYLSVLGRYGKSAKKALKKYLKAGQIQFLASDLHHSHEEYRIEEARKKLKRILKSSDKVEELLEENPNHILKNESII